MGFGSSGRLPTSSSIRATPSLPRPSHAQVVSTLVIQDLCLGWHPVVGHSLLLPTAQDISIICWPRRRSRSSSRLYYSVCSCVKVAQSVGTQITAPDTDHKWCPQRHNECHCSEPTKPTICGLPCIFSTPAGQNSERSKREWTKMSKRRIMRIKGVQSGGSIYWLGKFTQSVRGLALGASDRGTVKKTVRENLGSCSNWISRPLRFISYYGPVANRFTGGSFYRTGH